MNICAVKLAFVQFPVCLSYPHEKYRGKDIRVRFWQKLG